MVCRFLSDGLVLRSAYLVAAARPSLGVAPERAVCATERRDRFFKRYDVTRTQTAGALVIFASSMFTGSAGAQARPTTSPSHRKGRESISPGVYRTSGSSRTHCAVLPVHRPICCGSCSHLLPGTRLAKRKQMRLKCYEQVNAGSGCKFSNCPRPVLRLPASRIRPPPPAPRPRRAHRSRRLDRSLRVGISRARRLPLQARRPRAGRRSSGDR
jgi:hypothetical protein